MTSRLIFLLGLYRIKKRISADKGLGFYKQLAVHARKTFVYIQPYIFDIGNSAFHFNYAFAPAYISWYKAFEALGLPQDEIICYIWLMNESLFQMIPEPIRRRFGARYYLGGFQKRAPIQEAREEQGLLHDRDYKIRFRKISDTQFEIDFLTCPMKELCIRLGASGLLPGICRIDYMIAHYLYCGFSRTKTLGDGDDCCNCRYDMAVRSEWSVEEGFTYKK